MDYPTLSVTPTACDGLCILYSWLSAVQTEHDLKRILVFMLVLALTACNLPSVLTPTPTTGMCAYVEARQALPKLSEPLLKSLNAAALPVESARAEAYGENCLAADNTVVRFIARETDFYVVVNSGDLSDEPTSGNQIGIVLDIINNIPSTEVGPNPGNIGITFKSGSQTQNLWFSQTQANALRAQGLKGSELYRALKTKP
jgi:hypothetical protein